MHNLNRRAALATLTAGAAFPIATAASAGVGHVLDNLDALWLERRRLVAESKRISALMDDAERRLPEWSRPGPRVVLRKFVQRRRDRRAEEAKVGLPALHRASDANCEALRRLECEIAETSAGARSAAAALMIELSCSAIRIDEPVAELREFQMARQTLRHLRGALAGPLAEDVQAILDAPPGMKLVELPFVAS